MNPSSYVSVKSEKATFFSLPSFLEHLAEDIFLLDFVRIGVSLCCSLFEMALSEVDLGFGTFFERERPFRLLPAEFELLCFSRAGVFVGLGNVMFERNFMNFTMAQK
ncbi:hypothetical protein OXX59_004056 [Metschnikowia pulcherrima]